MLWKVKYKKIQKIIFKIKFNLKNFDFFTWKKIDLSILLKINKYIKINKITCILENNARDKSIPNIKKKYFIWYSIKDENKHQIHE